LKNALTFRDDGSRSQSGGEPPHSRRFTRTFGSQSARQRLEHTRVVRCFSTAFLSFPLSIFPSRLKVKIKNPFLFQATAGRLPRRLVRRSLGEDGNPALGTKAGSGKSSYCKPMQTFASTF
jgi:hypothetical protein